MRMRGWRLAGWAVSLLLFAATQAAAAEPAPTSQSRVEAALVNILTLERPGEDGLATVWDGNKYVQCRRAPEGGLRCEAAGALMQPTLSRVLSPERIARLAALGWNLNPSFGAYVQTFAADLPASEVAARILLALDQGYGADLADLEVQSDWIASEPCPPRNGPGQNLAGMINDAPAMAATAIHACAYEVAPAASPVQSATDLIDIYGDRVTGEIQRLRVNMDRRIFVILDTGAGYIQCQPQTSPRAIYCEAQSADSWPVLASVLTPERLARLHAAGYADPGRAPNYWRTYALDAFDDAAITRELLTILHNVYGYNGAPKLKFATEKGEE
jgi:hypothetical protein